MPDGKPQFKEGDKAISAKWLNDLEAARRMNRNRVGPGKLKLRDVWRTTVVITRKPVAGDLSLTVRRVFIPDSPPAPCNPSCHIAFRSTSFIAYADLGRKPMDYEDFFFDEAVDRLDEEATYLKAYREDARWFVEFPSGDGSAALGWRWCRILGEGSSASLIVQPVGLSTGGIFSDIGQPEEVLTQPQFDAQLWQDFTRFAGTPNQVIVPLVKVAGLWHALLIIPFYPQQAVPSLVDNDCAVD
jgi:hypothetical protein